MNFKLTSEYTPTGDQPKAIEELVDGINSGRKHQTLLGVTGSGKTYTMANVIQQINKPTLVLSHNKTLAAQLYGEFKSFFPENAVEYFVSYYDYYQPEAYMPVTDTYIEKDLSINEHIEKLRLRTTSSLLSGRKDVLVVSSVSCIYGIGNPENFHNGKIEIRVGQVIARNSLLRKFVDSLYSRSRTQLERGNFMVHGDTVDIFPAYTDHAFRISFFDDEIEEIHSIIPGTGKLVDKFDEIVVFPANIFVTAASKVDSVIQEVQQDLAVEIDEHNNLGKDIEASRLSERVRYDVEMIKELGYCSGVENYSRYFDGRSPGSKPFCLLDYFGEDYLMFIDESHATLPQVRAMYGGDRSRKQNLVDYGFRLKAALDNRPLQFEEFEKMVRHVIYVSATPAAFELEKSEGIITEQLIRPTGLLDPIIEIRPSLNQIDDLIAEINIRTEKKERVLVTTLTKRMAEELSGYLNSFGIKCRYMHSEIDTLDRVDIIRDLRLGEFDVLVGINLLREGLDLPEVSLVAILDADKEGFLRSERSLTQTAGRAARHVNGIVIMYADSITDSMRRTIDQTNSRREKQIAYNLLHEIDPISIKKSREEILEQSSVGAVSSGKYYTDPEHLDIAADPVIQYMSAKEIQATIEKNKKVMLKEAEKQNYQQAALLRDEIIALEKLAKGKK